MLQIIIIIVIIAVVWSILKAIFSGIADFIKEHPKGTGEFLFVGVFAVIAGYGYHTGEFGLGEVIATIVSAYVVFNIFIWIIKLILKIVFAIRRSMIISGIKEYFRSVSRTISYSKLSDDINRLYGGKKLKLDGSEYSDKYIDEEMSIFIESNQGLVKEYAVGMVAEAGKMGLDKAISTLISDKKNYCIGNCSLESFVDSVLSENFQRKPMGDGGTLFFSENRKRTISLSEEQL